MTSTAIILFAHGARDPRWAEPFAAIAGALRASRPDAAVHLAFLEFMSPSLVEAGADAATAGARSVHVVPLFLGAGGHVRKDLPGLMQTLQDTYPDVHWQLHPAIGEVPSVIHAMASAVAGMTPEVPSPSAA